MVVQNLLKAPLLPLKMHTPVTHTGPSPSLDIVHDLPEHASVVVV